MKQATRGAVERSHLAYQANLVTVASPSCVVAAALISLVVATSTSHLSSDRANEDDRTHDDGKEEALTVEIDFARSTPRSAHTRHWLPVLALTSLALGFYWNITRHLGDESIWPSDLMDGASFTWNMWHLPNELFNGNNPFVTDDIFHPIGARLGFHTYIPLIGLLMWPVTQLFGVATTFTVVTLLGPILSGIGTYFLAHYLTRNQWAALFAGAAYVMLPDRVLRMGGHVNLNHTEILPFGLLMLFRFYDNPSRRNAIGLGAITGASLLLESIFTAFLVMSIALVLVLRWRETLTKARLIGWAQAIVVGALVASPVMLAMTSEIVDGELDPLPGWGAADTTSADLLSYVVPAQFHPIWGDTFGSLYSKATAGEKFTFVGWTVLALAAVGLLAWRGRYKKTIVTMTAVFGVLSFGPFLHVAGKVGDRFHHLEAHGDIPLPFFAIHFVPVLNGVRVPARFGLLVDLLLALIAAFGLAWIFNRFAATSRKWLPPVLATFAIGVLAVECLPGDLPHMTRATIPAPYDAIKNDPGNKAVLELPLQWRDGFGQTGDKLAQRENAVFMYYATHHGKPISGGMVARYPDDRERQLHRIPVYSQVMSLQGDTEPQPITFDADDLKQLGIGYVVAHRDRPVPAAYDYVTSLQMPVMADDGTTIVWRVP